MEGIHMKSWLALGLALLLGACAGVPPQAPVVAPPWQQRTPGVAYAKYAPLPDSVVHVMRVDLQSPGVQILLTPPIDRGQVLPDMYSARDSVIAINASFFDKNWVPRGLTMSNREAWIAMHDVQDSPVMHCDGKPSCEIQIHGPFEFQPSWNTAVSGTPWLVDHGRTRTAADDATCEHLCAKTHPRTAVGLDASGRYLFIAVAEGRHPPVLGLTLTQLSAVMKQLGADNAINLDGGGSSTLMLEGKQVLQLPDNQPKLREVSNALVIRQLKPVQ